MAGLPPGDPQLVSMIVNHLKTQGLFDQFRRDCLADVDTKPAYLNLRQRVDNFVSNHLSNHTWSPHLNKNQLRNNIRQLVLQSGMLEQGVDRIVAQVVDPKIHHIFRPQVEKVVRQFLSPGSHVEEPSDYYPSGEERQDFSLPPSAPGTSASAMSILDTISSLNQEASSRSGGERNQKGDLAAEESVLGPAEDAAFKVEEDAVLNGSTGEQDMSLVEEEEEGEAAEKLPEEDENSAADVCSSDIKTEDVSEEMDIDRELEGQEVRAEEEEKEDQTGDEKDVKEEEGKDKSASRSPAKAAEEASSKDQDSSKTINEKQHIRQKARERLKEEYSLEDSDLEGLSDITVSSVHTSDLSSFEGESDDEPQPSDSTEEGEITSEDEKADKKEASAEDSEENKERKPGARRQGYVHKPFLYSRYYSDSDDEVTVEQRRRSAAKDKEERLLKRQQNRERLEEKRRTKQSHVEEQDERKAVDDAQRPRAKEACKEKKVLEKKVALSRKRKRDSRKEGDAGNKKKGDAEGDEVKKDESQRVGVSKSLASKSQRKVSESSVPDDTHRRKSGSVSEEPSEPRKLVDKNRTHSFILDLEQGSEELLRQRSSGKFDRHSRKDQHVKERKEKERDRSVSDESAKLKQKSEKKAEMHGDDSSQKEGAEAKEDKGEKKISKLKVEKKTSSVGREARASVSEGTAGEEGHRDTGPKKTKVSTTEVPKDKEKEKERTKGDKAAGKTDPRQCLPHLDSTGSSEERSDLEQGSEGSKKKDKLVKEVLKRSKSVTEVKHAEKHRSRHDSKDSDKDKVKGAYSSPERPPLTKSVSESDGEPRRSRDVELGSKGKMPEKSRSKSREDPKSPVLFKPDKKVSVQDTKNKGATPVGKTDAAKEKKKEGSSKEEKKLSEEHSSDKSQETKGMKKVSERKAKDLEKKGEVQGEKRGSKAADASLASPLSPTTPETPVLGRVSQPKELSMETEPTVSSEANTAIGSVAVSDDAFDALSDITPEPEGEDIAMRIGECEEEAEKEKEEPRPLPAEADALLSLMEVCSSAERNVVTEPEPRQEVTPSTGLTLQEADMKMKEAALTLLSMDPDMTLSPSLIDSHMAPVATEAVTPPEEMATTPSVETAAGQSLVDTSGNVQGAESVQPSEEMPADQHIPGEDVSDCVAASVETAVVPQEEEVMLKDDAALEHKKAAQDASSMLSVEPMRATSPSQGVEADTLVDQNEQNSQAASSDVKVDETKSRGRRRRVSSQTLASPSEAGSTSTVSDIPEVTEFTQPDSIENEGLTCSKEGEIPNESAVTETGEGQTKGDAGKQEEPLQETSVTATETQEQKGAEIEDKPEKAEVTRGARRGRPARLVKQSSSASQSDGQDEERGSDVSEMDEKSEGRVTRRGRRSAATVAKDSSGKPKTEKDATSDQSSEPQVEEAETAKVTETEAPRRGRSSKAAALSPESQQEEQGGEDEQKETEKVEEPVVRRGRRPGAQTKDAAAGKPSLKRKRSEETEDSGEEASAEEKKNLDGTESTSGQPSQESTAALSQPVEQQDEGKLESSAEMKSDNGEESGDKPQKKAPRRGRPSKAAAAAAAASASTEDADKAGPERKAKKAEEQEGGEKEEQEQQEEEEEEDGGGGEEEEAKPRATRSAARLEAEKNKPSKPSTRALSKVKDESTPNTRGAKGHPPTAAKGGRKREASPPAPRTRGGQKSEEPPAKRTKR